MTPDTHPPQDRTADAHLDEARLVDLAMAEEPHRLERAHLAGCSTCHVALTSLRRTVDATRHSAAVELVAPRPDVWAGIEAALDDEHPPGAVVPLRRVAAPTSPAPSRRRPALGWLAAACAAGVLVGAGGILAAERWQGPDADAGRTVATAELDTLDTGQRLGSASVSEQAGGVTLEVSARDLDAGSDGYVEVWLINRDGKRLVSVGVLGDGAQSGSFPISQRLLDEGYVVVDISREQFDDKPQHSGDSIVRGSLATPA